MINKIAILTDSSSEINQAEAKELGVYMLNLPLAIDGKEYFENIDITIEEIKENLRNGKRVQTSQATLGDLITMYDKLLEEYDQIIHVPLSSKLSGMYNTATTLSRQYDGRITVIDAKCACVPIAYLCYDIRKCLDLDMSPEAIKELVESEGHMLEACIIPQDINYLKMGGRISAAAAALAGLLKIVPILSVNDDGIDVYDKVRTEKKALSRMMDPILDVENYEDYYWIIIHDERESDALKMQAEVEKITSQKASIHHLGGTIISHTGPGTYCFGRLRKIVKWFR